MVEQVEKIVIPDELRNQLFSHCLRKFHEDFLPSETHEQKAYGIIGGYLNRREIRLGEIYPLKKNLRFDKRFDDTMSSLMSEHAVPSKTPFEKRGWVANPDELFKIYNDVESRGMIICGSYHMHVVPWKHDPLREIPTEIDTALAADSNMFQFIISLVNPERPVVRAFFEGKTGCEVPLLKAVNN